MTEKAKINLGLKDGTLLKEDLFIDGSWVASSSGERAPIINPATGEVIANIAMATREDVVRAIESSESGFRLWAKKTAIERAKIMRLWYQLILENVEDLALILTSEQGKPLAEAKAEIIYGAGFIEWYGEEGKRVYGETIPTNVASRRLLTIKQPIGVTASITPWNFPMAMIARKAGPALGAGCSMIIKPATETPLSANAIAELAARAGIPKGVLNVVVGEPKMVGEVITSSSIVKALSFTGSTEVGKILMAACAKTVKKVALELGGNAPLIIFDDADLDVAVSGVIASKFRNSGQTCVCANRILVQENIHDDFIAALKVAITELKVGNGLDPASKQGPLINEEAVAKVQSHISDALAKGATLISGGRRLSGDGTFFEPTIIAGVTAEMLICQEETFGPLAGVIKFKTEQEAIDIANDTQFGLAAYFFTKDNARTWRVGEALEVGVVGINTGLISYEGAPFGGVKESGIGREGSLHGVDEFVEIKYLCIDQIN
ncbi:MAG: NAD-dependent succinate-semialdehyde dehydrogenase [Micrococcales bacterium]|nr:NAD-dependent succinate-semialdehyde dehydrogenase [Micrococcales bacterium]